MMAISVTAHAAMISVGGLFFNLARRDLGDHDGRADHVARRFSPRGPLGMANGPRNWLLTLAEGAGSLFLAVVRCQSEGCRNRLHQLTPGEPKLLCDAVVTERLRLVPSQKHMDAARIHAP
jgi:hypothetical protein